MTTYSEYKDLQGKQNTIVDMLSDKLKSYPKSDLGMIEESVRMSDEYILLKDSFNKEFKKLQNINIFLRRNFKKEVMADVISNRNRRFNNN